VAGLTRKVLTGSGDYYSSGNDLSVFMQTDLSDEKAKNKSLEDARVLLLNFVNGFIRFPKVLLS
jgi:enoyl-CoA hydratase/carnithine racemase